MTGRVVCRRNQGKSKRVSNSRIQNAAQLCCRFRQDSGLVVSLPYTQVLWRCLDAFHAGSIPEAEGTTGVAFFSALKQRGRTRSLWLAGTLGEGVT